MAADTPLLPARATFTRPTSGRKMRMSVTATPRSSTPVMNMAGVSASILPDTRLPRLRAAMVLDRVQR